MTLKVFKFFYYDKPKTSKDPILNEKYNLIKWFPIYYVITCIPAIFIRLFQVFGKKELFGFQVLMIILEQTTGVILFWLTIFSPPFNFIFYDVLNKICRICLKKSIDGEKSRASSFKVSRNYLSRIDSPKTDSERRQSEIYFEDNKVNMKIVMEESEYASVSNNERINVSDLGTLNSKNLVNTMNSQDKIN